MSLWKAQLAAVSLLMVFFPFGKVQEHRVKFIVKPLKITTTKATPPRLAFMQVLSYDQKAEQAPVEPMLSVNLSDVIAKRQLRPLNFVLERRQVSLPEILITRAEIFNQQAALQELTQNRNLENPKFDEPVRASRNTAQENWPQELTDNEKRWLKQANLSQTDFDVFNEPTLDPVGEGLQAKIAAELNRPTTNALPGWIISQPTGGAANAPVKNFENANPSVGRNAARAYAQTNRNLEGYSIQGRIGLGSGVILSNGEHIEIHWVREGSNKVAGVISTENDYRYEVKVSELVGSVNAEMYDAAGQLKAKGTLRLSQASASGDITLYPQRSLASQNTDFYHSPTKLFGAVPFKKAKSVGMKTKVSIDTQSVFEADDKSNLRIDGVTPGSTAFGFTKAKGYYPAIHWMTTGAAKAFPAIPSSTVNAWKDIVRNQRNLTPSQENDGAFVVGQATKNGQPVAGVSIEMIQNPDTKPVYLNQLLIPDPALTATSSNGYFIFMDLENGYYSIRASAKGFFFGFSNFLAEEDSVSFAEVQEAHEMAPFEARVFDAFQGTDEPGALEAQGLNLPIDVDGYGQFDHPITDQIELVQVQPRNNDMLPSLFVMKGDDDHVHLPLVRKQWMEQMAATLQLSPQPGTGIVLGFVSKGNYQVQLPHLKENAPVSVVFFDSVGNRVEHPVENGGFIAFNVPASAHTVVVRDNFGETSSQIIPVDGDRVTTVRFLF